MNLKQQLAHEKRHAKILVSHKRFYEKIIDNLRKLLQDELKANGKSFDDLRKKHTYI
jgi:6,7-dimethyl-8-ribityllumazine synthase